MGVHGLWELLAPVGHRVSNESVRNKVLAVDVSIWLTQFVKAMRDAEGAQVRNGHLLGVFRRCIKLLYLSVKPVLIFDGATPPLKRRTLTSRRAQREKHAAKLRRLAEKMLLNRIKQRSVDHAIAKKRKGKPQKTSTHLKKNVPSSSIHSKHQDCEPVDPNHQQGVFSNAVIPSSQRRQENAMIPRDKPSRGFEDVMFSDDSYDVTDIDDMQISLPQNVDDLDDEVLMKLPSKLQSEVFKQAKLTQRARHRENMMQEEQRPSEFSKMQIEGFLRHTALNRKISRVRNVLNAKSGASRRIASDNRRGFVLREDTLTETHAITEGGQSEDEWEEAKSPDAKSGCRVQLDLLADIRARKEAFMYNTPSIIKKKRPLDMHPHLESGNEWASKVLQANGSLDMSSKIPDVTFIECDDQPWFHAKQEFRQSREEQQHPGISFMKKNTNVNADQNEEIIDKDDSDDEEWEDGNQPTSNVISEDFGKERIKENLNSGRLRDRSASDEYQEPAKSDTTFRHGRPNDKGSCSLMKKPVATKETDQLTTSRRNLMPSISHHDVTHTVGKFAVIPHSPIGKDIGEDHRVVYEGRCAPTEQKSKRKKPVKGLAQIAKINSRDGDGRARHFSDETFPEDRHKPLILRTTEVQMPNSSKASEKRTELRGGDKPDGASSSSKIDHQTYMLGEGNSLTRDALCSTLREHAIPCASKEGIDHRTEAEGCNRKLQSNEMIPICQVRSTESKTSRESSEKKSETIAENQRSSGGFHASKKGETESLEAPTRNPASSWVSPTAKEHLDDAHKERTRYASDESEIQEPSDTQLEIMQKELEGEAREIDRQRSSYRRGAETVADEMYSETRDLIKLLGIPYLEAPMEAEAQCAFLNKEKIVHGVLTEDSDAFLFGAVTVYRHLFAEGRFAEAYEANDIEQCLGLDQEQLIRLAYLLGSDYTSGVRGVGIVNSMEILEAFPGPVGLAEFRDWMKSVTLLDEEPEKEILKSHSTEAVRRRFCWKHRNMKRNWEIREGFPNPAVFEAYKEPVVDKCREKFSWGSIDFEGLAKFCWDKFGWDHIKFDGAVGPLRQKLQETSGSSQRRIDEFFRPHRFAKIRSERLQKAVQGIAGDMSTELIATTTRAKRRAKLTTQSIKTQDCTHDETEPDGV